jgi:hypothetical protein
VELYFCERCAARIADVELERGIGRRVGDSVWCKSCVEYSPGYGEETQPAPGSSARGPLSRPELGRAAE